MKAQKIKMQVHIIIQQVRSKLFCQLNGFQCIPLQCQMKNSWKYFVEHVNIYQAPHKVY